MSKTLYFQDQYCSYLSNPTQYTWTNEKGETLYFRLKNGKAKIVNTTTYETLFSVRTKEYDNICFWHDIKKICGKHGLVLKEIFKKRC